MARSSDKSRSVSPRRSRRSISPHRSSRKSRYSRSPSPHHSSRKSRYSRSPSPHRSSKSHSKRSRSPTRRHHRHRSSSPRRSRRSYSRDSKEDRKKHKKHKKEKKSKKEFQAWLIEIQNANVETLSNNKRKEMFGEFMEDYNTATLPHKKFYNIEKWEKRQEAIRMGEHYTDDRFDFAKDEERLRMQHKQAAKMAASRQPVLQLSEEQIKELTRVNRERVEADRMRKMGLKPKEGMGVRYEEVSDL
ncbi:unnamed protein product [Rhizopus stolonifer]